MDHVFCAGFLARFAFLSQAEINHWKREETLTTVSRIEIGCYLASPSRRFAATKLAVCFAISLLGEGQVKPPSPVSASMGSLNTKMNVPSYRRRD